ncbi:MAG: VTT domain-containing protein [Candidatus Pacebacteria bacterium]|nr:VTT domain-containing protein [Candidatus Paceibacterota bacterium]
MPEFLNIFLEPKTLIMALGTLGVIAVIFIETGLFFGFFLPGDSLLFTAGFLASQGYVSFAWLLIGTFIAAVVGDSIGYAFGKKIGPSLFSREDSVIFNKQHIVRAQQFYEKHGKKTIILARFMPIIRTFAPIVAGIGTMPYRTFITFNIIGAFIWTWGMLWLGYGLGALIPNPDKYVIPVVIVIILVSAAPAIKEIVKEGIRRWKS